MARTKTHRITWEDGTQRYRKLSSADVERWQKLARDKTTDITSVEPAEPAPFNAAPSSVRK